jgi:glycosyltransferase involved in cell wall biosynthesis
MLDNATPIAVPTVNDRVALIYDWIMLVGGGENVIAELIKLCPSSELFVAFMKATRDADRITQGRPVHVSRLNSLPMVERYYRHLLLLGARAIERFDVSGFDVVVSTSSAYAKGIITAPDQPHIGYILSPARYAWDLTHEYLRLHGLENGLKGLLAREIMHRFRKWDSRTPAGVDVMVSISEFVRRRVWKVYRRDSLVLYPPVATERFKFQRRSGRHFVTMSRLVGYKRVDLAVRAFAKRPDLKLVVVGEGPELNSLKQMATANVEFTGKASLDTIENAFSDARAFLYGALEDFGISPVEAQAAGIPVIAFGRGGSAETIRGADDPASRTGVFFYSQSPEALLDAISEFERCEERFDDATIRRNAERFSTSTFHRHFATLIGHAHELAGTPRSEARLFNELAAEFRA